eukprot:688078-Amorphochlora_amoeboformis.AAC.1
MLEGNEANDEASLPESPCQDSLLGRPLSVSPYLDHRGSALSEPTASTAALSIHIPRLRSSKDRKEKSKSAIPLSPYPSPLLSANTHKRSNSDIAGVFAMRDRKFSMRNMSTSGRGSTINVAEIMHTAGDLDVILVATSERTISSLIRLATWSDYDHVMFLRRSHRTG